MKKICAAIILACSSAYGLTLQDLEIPGGESWATGLNNSGQVIGFYDEGYFLWQNGETIKLGAFERAAINDAGIIAGDLGFTFPNHMIILNLPGGGSANAVSNRGIVVGHWGKGAFMFDGAQTTFFAMPGDLAHGSFFSVNDSNVAVGLAQTSTGEGHAII